ncbi:MAG TPA: FGGY-family carbohydrate kinase [Acidimicrobiia bacterium]|jgi:xylulokinase|nr:FGGY-family carbohydrate kinase [Acidimicrobiia bacterium]
MTSSVTIGIDIGTSSVKAIAADADGTIVASARIPHTFSVPAPLQFEHDARVAWFDGPRAALEALGPVDAAGVAVAAMVPSLTAVDASGVPCAPGLLYGDERGSGGAGNPVESGEFGRFLGWLSSQVPDARGFWPAQAVANFALCGEGVISTTGAMLAYPLFDGRGWDESVLGRLGVRAEQMPRIAISGTPAGEITGRPGCVLEGGTIDAMGEQIVAGADHDGDVLVICGTTLIIWCVTAELASVPGFFPLPHTAPGKFLVGGPSNAGGMFLDWARRLLREGAPAASDPVRVPVWVPYLRGERTPLDDTTLRAQLVDLDLTHGPAEVRRAAFEAAGFITRRMIDASPTPARRIVATGGGVRVGEWVQCLADCTGLPVDVVAIPEGGALGAAFLARLAAGLETSLADAARWARTDHRVEPDPAWAAPVAARYQRFLELA